MISRGVLEQSRSGVVLSEIFSVIGKPLLYVGMCSHIISHTPTVCLILRAAPFRPALAQLQDNEVMEALLPAGT